MKQKVLLSVLLFAGLSSFGQQPVIPAVDSNAVKDLFFAGLREKLNENYVRAGENFNKILSIDPGNAAVHYEIASINYRQNKLKEAEYSIKRAVAGDANNLWYWKMLAELYKRKGDMENLIGVFDQMIRLSPENDAYYFDKSNAYLLMGNDTEALKGYDALEKKFGSSPALLQARQRISMGSSAVPAAKDVNKMLSEDLGDIKSHLDMSETLAEKGQFEAAVAVLKKAKALDPESYEVDLALADNYKSLKNETEALNALKAAFANAQMPVERKVKIVMMLPGKVKSKQGLQQASELAKMMLQQHPEDPKVMALYADLLYQQGALSDALQQYLAVLKITDELYPVWEQALSLQTNLGLYKDAIKTADAALSVYPNQAILYYYMAFALHRDDQNAPAMSNIKSALQLDAENKELQAMIFALQGEISIDEQQFQAANTAFDKAVKLAPSNYLIVNNYAYYLALRNQQLPKAESLIANAAQAVPGNASIADTYALILFKLGKYDDALLWIEKALKNNNAENSVYLEHYGDILFLKGDKEQALTQWQKAKDAGNDAEKLTRKINEKKYIK